MVPGPDKRCTEDEAVAELRALSMWSEGQVWCSPERHGAVSVMQYRDDGYLPEALDRKSVV